ncbi:MAG: IS1634 family transposase [Actinobacteria bacterium]|nr:IS1634 family transposase [Actinomycetota bacterium]
MKIKTSNRRGAKKYIKQESSDINYFLDAAAIEKESRFDGYYAIATNQDNLDAEDILSAYNNLWKIEQSFRIMKSSLEVRPIFVWTKKRIKGHFVVCFLSFLFGRHLEFRLNKNGIAVSAEKIREALNSCNFVKVSFNQNAYFIKAKATELAHKTLRILKIKPPKTLLPKKN